MNQKYLIRYGKDNFIKVTQSGFQIISDYKKASTFSRIGDAMSFASEIIKMSDNFPVVKAERCLGF